MVAILVWVVAAGQMILYALVITGAVFVFAIAYLGWATWLTSRREREDALRSTDARP